MDAIANLPVTTVATAPDPATTGTSLVVATAHGVRLPTAPFTACVCPATGGVPTLDNAEFVRVTVKSTDTLTIVREQEGTSARTIVEGDLIFAVQSKAWFDSVLLWQVKTSAYTAVNGDRILADTKDTAAFTVTLPASPTAGDKVVIADPQSYWSTNNLTVGRNGSKINSAAEDLVCDRSALIELIYIDSTIGWQVNVTSVSQLFDATNPADLGVASPGTSSYVARRDHVHKIPTLSDLGIGNITNDAQTKASVVPNTTPSAGEILVGSGTAYAKQAVSGDATLGSTGALTITNSRAQVALITAIWA